MVPSPQSHSYEATVPSGSCDAAPSAVTLRPAASTEKAAVGGAFGPSTGTSREKESSSPLLSRTVRVTVNVPVAS